MLTRTERIIIPKGRESGHVGNWIVRALNTISKESQSQNTEEQSISKRKARILS